MPPGDKAIGNTVSGRGRLVEGLERKSLPGWRHEQALRKQRFGLRDATSRDPATDLAALWMLLPVEAHRRALDAYGPPTPATWQRARGWAVFFGVTLLDARLGNDPRFATSGERTLSRITEATEPSP